MAFSNTPNGLDIFGRVGKFKDAREVAMGKNFVVTTFPGQTYGCVAINVRVPDLREIDYILEVSFTMNPLSCAQPVFHEVNKTITGNVVGMTIFGLVFATGTTLTVEVIAAGK